MGLADQPVGTEFGRPPVRRGHGAGVGVPRRASGVRRPGGGRSAPGEGVSDVGRHGLMCGSVLRCGILKQLRGESYRQLAFALRASRGWTGLWRRASRCCRRRWGRCRRRRGSGSTGRCWRSARGAAPRRRTRTFVPSPPDAGLPRRAFDGRVPGASRGRPRPAAGEGPDPGGPTARIPPLERKCTSFLPPTACAKRPAPYPRCLGSLEKGHLRTGN